MNISYLHEPDDLRCGQAVLAMLTGIDVEKVSAELDNFRETDLKQMKSYLRSHGFRISDARVPVQDKTQLPPIAVLSLETPRCWHWSLYCEGVFYDPEHGVMDDFPVTNRKYYWEVKVDRQGGL